MKKKILTILLSSAMIFSMGISTVSAAAADDTASTESMPIKGSHTHSSVAAALHTESGITIALYNDASPEFLRNLIGAASHAE